MKLIPVSKTKHAGFGFSFSTDVFKNWDTVPLSSAEFFKVLAWAVVAFKKVGSVYQPVLLSGLVKGRNIYVHPNGQKLVMPYLPAAMRAYPFKLVERNGEKTLMVVESESRFNDRAEKALLNAEGEMTDYGQEFLVFLDKLSRNADKDALLLEMIAKFNLLKPFVIRSKDLKSNDEQVLRDDLFVVDEEALKSISDEQAGLLLRAGALHLISAQLLSMVNWPLFNRFCEASERETIKMENAVVPDLDAFFGGDDDTLKF